MALPDIQSNDDNFIHLPINWVGVDNVVIPIFIRQKSGGVIHTVGSFGMYTNLPADKKGTHMSRFIIELNKYKDIPVTIQSLEELSKQIITILESDSSLVGVKFSYFIQKNSPVTNLPGLLNYECEFAVQKFSDKTNYVININTNITSLCPCSKAISKNGAHNQRGTASIFLNLDKIDANKPLWIEDLINISESSGSCELYSVLKREDEKFVTELAYDNPKFCEDIAREIAYKINKIKDDYSISKYTIIVNNNESIHNHDAISMIHYNC